LGVNEINYNPYLYTGLKAGLNSRNSVSAAITSPFGVKKDEFILTSAGKNEYAPAEELKQQLLETKKEQGFIGKLWDGFKNLTGIGAGSRKAEQAIEKLEKGEITQEEALKALEGYKEGQKQCVDTVADIVSGIVSFAAFSLATATGIAAAPFTGGASLGLVVAGFAMAGAAGAASKVAIKGLDAASGGRKYSGKDLVYDIATGGVNGMFAPITAGIGGAAGKAVAGRLGVQAIREGGEVLVKEGLESTVRGTITKTLLTTSVDYVGGTAGARALCLATDMAVNGAISGAVDSSTRYLAGEEENKSLSGLLQNAGQGAAGGLIMSPLIGGGMRLAGKGINKVTNNINRNMTFDMVMPEGVDTAFRQGSTGDCHLVSTLDAMLHNPQTSKLVKKAILTTSDGNYQVKIGDEIVTVAKNAIPENILADNQGIRIFEQAYRQLNGGDLDGGFAEIVSKQFGLNPLHIAQADLSDEVIEKIAREQKNLVLSAGIEIDGQRHYLSVRNIDTQKGIVTLVDPLDTSKVIQKPIAEFKNELISLDGGSVKNIDLPNSARNADEVAFRGRVIAAGIDEDMVKRYGFSVDEVLEALELDDSIREGGEKTLAAAHFVRQSNYFESSQATLLDAVSIYDSLKSELLSPGAVDARCFLTEAEKKLLIDPEKIRMVGEYRRLHANEIKISIDSQAVASIQSPDVLLKVGEVDGSEKSIYCLDQALRIAPSKGNVSVGFTADLAKGSMITSECLDAYAKLADDAALKNALGGQRIAYFQNQYNKTKVSTTALDLIKRAQKEGLSSLTVTERHKLDEIFSDMIKGAYDPKISKIFLKELAVNPEKYGKIQGLVQVMKETFAKNGLSAESDHFYLRLIDRDLLGTFDSEGNFLDFNSLIKRIKKELPSISPVLKTGEGKIEIAKLNNLVVQYRYDEVSRKFQLITVFHKTQEL